MKKSFTLFLGIIIYSFAWAQEPIEIMFCGKPANEINIGHVKECKTLITNNTDFKVISFSIGFLSDGNYVEGKMSDNSITNNIIDLIVKANPDVIYIENIELINKKGVHQKIKPIKVFR